MNGFGPFSAFFSSVTWAIGSSNYSKFSRNHSAFTVNFTRAAIALPCFLLAALLQYGGPSATIQAFRDLQIAQLSWLGVSVIASYALGDAFFFWSSQVLGVPGALAISSIFPVWTAFAAYLFYGENLNAHQWIGLVAVVGGVVTVILSEPRGSLKRCPNASRASNDSSKSLEKKTRSNGMNRVTGGVLLAVASSFFWAINSYSVSRGGHGVSATVSNSVRMVIALPFCRLMAVLFGFRRGKAAPLFLPLRLVREFSWVFVLEAFGGSFFFVYGLSHSPLAVASTLTSLAPVLSVPVALALKVERYSLKRILGVCWVVIGLCLLVGPGLG
jgi:drug/metabolite transporter (DMT)-like permease